MMVACEETVGLSNFYFYGSHNQKPPGRTFCDELGTSTGPWPRYLVMTATDEGKTLSKLSPFAIHKGVKGIAGGDVTIKRQFSGDIYLTCSKKSQSDNLLKCVLFGNVAPVVVTQHKSLNTSKGVIRNWELARTNPEEIKDNVPSIIDVQRITIKRNNMEVKTNTLILTFNSPKITESLKICYLNIPVSQYVPNPLRCYTCQRFGHVTSKCKHSETCAKCSETGHKDESCTKSFKCANCGENHAAYSKKCTVYKKEYDIQSIRVSSNISFFEARMIYKKNSWTEGDELCWIHQGSNPARIDLHSDRCVVGWGTACYTEATSCCFCY